MTDALVLCIAWLGRFFISDKQATLRRAHRAKAKRDKTSVTRERMNIPAKTHRFFRVTRRPWTTNRRVFLAISNVRPRINERATISTNKLEPHLDVELVGFGAAGDSWERLHSFFA